ncbi:MAG: tol-pal system protein YbgF [Acidobacteria bacterium]|nr:tol-pal system protein YbgF [Acidobacteriota bacterium]
MKRLIFAFILLICISSLAGTKEDIEKLQNDLLLLQKKYEALSAELLSLNKKLEIIENKIDGLQRSSQTADIRVDLDTLKIEIEKLNSAVSEIKTLQSYSSLKSSQDENKSPISSAPLEETPEKLYQSAYSDYIQGRFQLALSGFQKFAETYPSHPLVENCYYWIGECYYGIKDYDKAKEYLEKVMSAYPKGTKFYSAKLKLALVHYNIGEKELAKKMLVEIIKDNPTSTESGIAKEKLRILFQE